MFGSDTHLKFTIDLRIQLLVCRYWLGMCTHAHASCAKQCAFVKPNHSTSQLLPFFHLIDSQICFPLCAPWHVHFAWAAALWNEAQTVFICFLLGFGAMTFSQDANRQGRQRSLTFNKPLLPLPCRLVLTPIERMISKLDKIRNNPLEAMTIGWQPSFLQSSQICIGVIRFGPGR